MSACRLLVDIDCDAAMIHLGGDSAEHFQLGGPAESAQVRCLRSRDLLSTPSTVCIENCLTICDSYDRLQVQPNDTERSNRRKNKAKSSKQNVETVAHDHETCNSKGKTNSKVDYRSGLESLFLEPTIVESLVAPQFIEIEVTLLLERCGEEEPAIGPRHKR